MVPGQCYLFSGKLRQITVNDLPVGRDVDESLRLVQAFQFTDKHGEVCPAGWKPGKATMVPNPKDSQAYFQQANAIENYNITATEERSILAIRAKLKLTFV